ncbi:bifunctional fucokinase/fucose-1-phosphate guanylyltransferase [Puniceicoccus vermicola]|uniref:Bifunctional fucokinase/L-fucose-1-P-guanylyltransferase n=1 Tax=Puniceicoccus vermicola TaxID=388746 RepID=A0A7X1E7Y2_9BACT|nr:bifunctional fucokinase/fucose-1-phosphate guanylyltransferase [Puniceicoccus vermicola]MBC2604222.1 bifunctional fucokinase/L-fucose-1-P-guanylyltransferase [Puniceicoccus vermicola]
MKTLLSVPPALSRVASSLIPATFGDCFVTHDPEGAKLGSGGGTAHLLREAWRADGESQSFAEWLQRDDRVLVHAGGQSRRLPAYAALGKALLPVPVFRWCAGQRLDQTLGELQLPLLQKILEAAGAQSHTLIASGDVLIWNDRPLPEIPDADVVCVGLWDSPETAAGHGVFFTPRAHPEQFDFMLQKPDPSRVAELSSTHLFLLDIGIWLLSDRAVEVLMRKSGWNPQTGDDGELSEYDLYGEFGLGLGENPTVEDPELAELTCAVLPLSEAEFHHFGTNRDLIGSSLALQNRVNDQRRIFSPLIKPHPSIFIQNAEVACSLGSENQEVWIENSSIPDTWKLSKQHVITGIPENDWIVKLSEGTCLDVVPIGGECFAVRVYGFHDRFRGDLNLDSTTWMGKPAADWFRRRRLPIPEGDDLQKVPLFPVLRREEMNGKFMRWIVEEEPREDPGFARLYRDAEKLSAEELANRCAMERVDQDRKRRLVESLPVLARHAGRSVFYQSDLYRAAELAAPSDVVFDEVSPAASENLYACVRSRMFHSALERMRGGDGSEQEAEAFRAMRNAIVDPYRRTAPVPRNSVLSDQVIWARSPVRLDLAGGWTDTPPYCFLNGGRVVNLSVELNGQPPVQIFARTSDRPGISLRSIDLGSEVSLRSYEDIGAYAEIGSDFAIPRAALALCGFHPDFQSGTGYPSLDAQLEEFGGGLEITLLCAIPKGSGLGTSSVLSSALLACLSELAGYGWDSVAIGNRVLALEQMLTSGGGWQDQYGGAVRGLKMLETGPGLDQTPDIRWLPGHLFTDPQFQGCRLLYYTGVTRVAHNVLSEIVRGMFLNRQEHLRCLEDLSDHALRMYECLQKGDFERMGRLVDRTWELNQRLDSGTCTPVIQKILEPLNDWLLGKKLLGAGGGGYLLMFAKDEAAALRIRRHLQENPPNARARFVDFSLSETGLQVTRS